MFGEKVLSRNPVLTQINHIVSTLTVVALINDARTYSCMKDGLVIEKACRIADKVANLRPLKLGKQRGGETADPATALHPVCKGVLTFAA